MVKSIKNNLDFKKVQMKSQTLKFTQAKENFKVFTSRTYVFYMGFANGGIKKYGIGSEILWGGTLIGCINPMSKNSSPQVDWKIYIGHQVF